jgi:hypothetical protein
MGDLSAHSLLTPLLLTHLRLIRQLNLSNNRLCGVWSEYGHHQGKYNAEGINAIADALRVNGVLTSIDLSNNQLCGGWTDYRGQHGTYTAEGITAIADAMRVNGALTVTNLLGNQLDAESAKMLAEVAKQKGISLCGIRRDQTTADFRNKYLEPADAILLASDLSQAVVTGGLTRIDLSGNQLCGIWTDGHGNQQGAYTAEGITAIADALRVNSALTSLDLSNNALCGVVQTLSRVFSSGPDGVSGTYTAEGITAIADALRVNGALTEVR